MNSADGMIVVVNRDGSTAENVKELIEFMDAPSVCAATPAKWQEQVGDGRLEAVFIGPDLSEKDIRAVVHEIGERDPNIPIVVLTEDDTE